MTPTNAPLADSHLHLFDGGYPIAYGPVVAGGDDAEAYEVLRQRHNIDSGLVVGYEGPGVRPGNNDYIRRLADTRPWMRTVAYIAPGFTAAPAHVAVQLDRGHVGLALYLPDAGAAQVLLDWPAATWDAVESANCLVSINAAPPEIAAVAPLVQQRPGCTFLFAHLGLPGRCADVPTPTVAHDLLRPLLSLSEYANCVVKLSAMYSVSDPPHAFPHQAAQPMIEHLLAAFTIQRCVWGSDFSPALEHVSMRQTIDVAALQPLSATERSAVMGGNLRRLLAAHAAG